MLTPAQMEQRLERACVLVRKLSDELPTDNATRQEAEQWLETNIGEISLRCDKAITE